jgi:hypothetical protein
MIEQIPNDVNLLTEEIKRAKIDDALQLVDPTMGTWASSVRLRALEIAVKIGDPDIEIGLPELLINADALVRYINGIDRNAIGMQWRDDIVALHQQRETPLHEPDA